MRLATTTNIVHMKIVRQKLHPCSFKGGRWGRHFVPVLLFCFFAWTFVNPCFCQGPTQATNSTQINNPSNNGSIRSSGSYLSEGKQNVLAPATLSASFQTSDVDMNQSLALQFTDLKKDVDEERKLRVEEIVRSADAEISFAHAFLAWGEVTLALITLLLLILAAFGWDKYRKYSQATRKVEKTQQDMETLKTKFNDEIRGLLEVSYNFNMGQACYKQDAFSDAVKYFKKVERYRQDDADLLINLARSYIGLGNEIEALIYFEKAKKLEPDSAIILTKLASAYRYKNLKKAYELIQAALQIEPNNHETLNYAGLVLRDMGRYRDAIEAHLKSLHSKKSRADTFFFLSLLFMHENDKEQSRLMMQKARTALDYQETDPDQDSPREVWRKLIVLSDDIINDRRDDARNAAGELKNNLASARTRKAVWGHLEFLQQSLTNKALIADCIKMLKD